MDVYPISFISFGTLTCFSSLLYLLSADRLYLCTVHMYSTLAGLNMASNGRQTVSIMYLFLKIICTKLITVILLFLLITKMNYN